jgi:sugar phosphate isomerase/epimerase
MKRRDFLSSAGMATGTLLAGPALLSNVAIADPMSRIGLTTVVFRNQFSSTNPELTSNEFTLRDIPQYFSERFGIRNLEFWSEHFESREPAYLKDLKKSIQKDNCQLINIQADTPGKDISNSENGNSALAVQEIKEWIDVGKFLGSKMVRASFIHKSFEEGMKSMKSLIDYSNSQGMILLAENHFDLLSIPENHLELAQKMKGEGFGLLADFGNYPENIDRYEALKMIAPYTLLVSAKTHAYDDNYNHISFDFDRCVQIMEEGGFSGIYSLEQWENGPLNYDFEKIVDWMIEHVSANIS